MKKILLIATIICCSIFGANAQLAVVELSPALNQDNKTSLNDLLQFYVQSNSDTPISVFIQVAIEKQNFGVVSVLKTDIIDLATGVTPAPVLVGPNGSRLQIKSARIGYENIKHVSFLFPDGNYNYCVEIRNREGVLIHKDCSKFETINPNTFFLVYPFDHQEVDEDRPVFTWTPLITLDGRDIDYRIRWIEKDEKANANHAFYNTPDFYQVLHVEENLLPYKIEYPEFDPEKYYYWQVEAFSGRTILAKSDIWEFHFSRKKEKEKPGGPFVKVDLERFTDVYEFAGDFLCFEWRNPYRAQPFKYKILDFDNRVVLNESEKSVGMARNGKNKFQLDVSEIVSDNKIYTLEIQGSKKVYRIKFKKISI